MKVEAKPAVPTPRLFRRAVRIYEDATGQFVLTWALVALLNFLTQALLFYAMVGRDKITGEFGVFNAALGIIGLLTLPAVALPLALRLFFARARNTSLDRLRESSAIVIETFVWVWGGVCFVLILLPLPLPSLPRFALELFTLMNVLLALGAVISCTVCEAAGQRRRWALLVVGACLTRLVLSDWFVTYQGWAETALAGYVVAGFITLAPALRPREIGLAARLRSCAASLDGSFLHFAAATLSVLLGIYLFTNADRITSLGWYTVRINGQNVPSTQMQHVLDSYQATGLLARAILWGTQPLLWVLYVQRSKLDKTTPASLTFFWIYLGTLVASAFALGCLTQKGGPIDAVLPGAGALGPTFASLMLPLGLMQGLAVFVLASKRWPECFVIGGCSFIYTLVLVVLGRRFDTTLQCMFYTSLVALAIVLFVGVVRWGRKQP